MPQADDGGALAAVVFFAGEAEIAVDGGAGQSLRACPAFLHPFRETKITRTDAEGALSVWVPWDSLSDIRLTENQGPVVLAETTLVAGLRAFAWEVVQSTATSSQYTDYLVERLLAEMVFGVILEATGDAPDARAVQRPIERARALMLLRREDPGFGVDDLAREMHMSTRQLQRVFAKADSSPAEELRRMRVEFATSLLVDDALAPLSMDEVARHAGFGGAASMRRAFAAAGVTVPARRHSR